MSNMKKPGAIHDPIWLPLTRFSGKFSIAMICAAIGREPFALAAAFWLAVYALSTSIIALFRREEVKRHRLTRWDEVVFLFLFSLLFMAIHRHG